MPWQETCFVRERMKLVVAYESGEASMSELCRRLGVSRRTGHKWWNRYCELGLVGLEDRSSRPRTSPQRTSTRMEEAVVRARQAYPTWGPPKLRAVLLSLKLDERVPAASTIGAILKREGMVFSRRRKRRTVPSASPFAAYGEPNAVWCVDFKGQFPTGHRTCYPLTLIDGYSRYLIACESLSRPDGKSVRKVLHRAFQSHGLPAVIRSDNGPPFASIGAGGLSMLGVWLIKLRVLPERIERGRPDQNGRLERFHRTLKEATASPPASSLLAQQRRFDAFRQLYNHERPHQALGQAPPISFYEPSGRPMPWRYVDPEYPPDHELHRTDRHGAIRWRGFTIRLNSSLDRELVGMKQTDERNWEVYFGPVRLGALREPRRRAKSIRLDTRRAPPPEEELEQSPT